MSRRSFFHVWLPKKRICSRADSGSSESSSFRYISTMKISYVNSHCCSLPSPQPPTPPSSRTIQHPGELLQVVRQSTTRRLMNCTKCIVEMWNMDGVGEGEEVKLTLRDRGLAVAEQGRTSPGYMFMHWGWRSEELRERRQDCGLFTANENKWSSHSPSIPHNGMFPS